MTAEDLIHDVLEIKNAVEDDSDLDELWLLTKIDSYRALYIVADYIANHEIRSSWLQRIRKQKTTKVTAADDPAITTSSISLSKVTLPPVVALPEDLGINRLSGSSGILSFDQVDFDTLMLKLSFDEVRTGQFGFFSRIGNDYYLHPLTMEIQGVVIASNPFDIQVLENDVMRDMLVTDEYPIDSDMAQKIVLDILTKDLQINAQSVSDIINDAQTQLKLLQNGINQKSANQ